MNITHHSNNLKLPHHVHLIGCGGTGSWVAPALSRLCGRSTTLHLWDADTLEAVNLDRQLFPPEFIGRNKASALGAILHGVNIQIHEEYFFSGAEIPDSSLLLCCADNQAARLACIIKSDEMGIFSIISGNEFTDADAYIYHPMMRSSPNDPREFAPEIMHSSEGDPRAPGGCTGAVATASPQLVLANMSAANYLLRLMWWWFSEIHGLDQSTRPFWPVLHHSSASRGSTILFEERMKQSQDKEMA